MRNLILSGGIRHDFAANTRAVADLLAAVGVSSEQTEDIDHGIERLASEAFDLVTVNALRWRMQGNPKYAALRDEYGYSMPSRSRSILAGYIRQGGGLLGLHTACICFDDWREWRDILGGTWAWGQSFHPPPGPVTVASTGRQHSLTSGLPGFELIDEVYANLDLADDVQPLLTARAEDGTEAPVLWARQLGKGRVVFDALGHDRKSLLQEDHGRLLQRCALWCCGISDRQVAGT